MSATATLVAATATGAVSAVQAAVFEKTTDQNPALTTTTGKLTFTFTTATTLPAGSVMITLRSNVGNYLTTVNGFTTMMGTTPAAGPTGNCQISSNFGQTCASTGCTGAIPASTTYQVISCAFTSALTAGVVTLSLTAGTYTVGSSQPAAMYTVSTSNNAGTIDVTSTTMGTLPALAAGAVSAATAAFSVPGDMVPGTTTLGTLTFGFTTATDLAVNAVVMIYLPVGYLASASQAKLGANSISCTLGSATIGTCPSTAYQQLACTVGTAASKGAQSLVLQIGQFMVGPKNAGTTYMVWTTGSNGAVIDTPASGTVPAITAGTASVSGTAAPSKSDDMIPGTTASGTLTFSFTTMTALPKDKGNIVFSLTPFYLKTATAATLTGGSPATTSTCSNVQLTQGSLATCTAAAVMQTITCSVATANLAAGSYSLVLSANSWSVNNAQSAGTFSVMTTNNGVTLDASSASTGILPAYGGTAAVTAVALSGSTATAEAQKIGTVTVNAVLSITFTTVTKVVTGGSITFTFPTNYLTASAGTLAQGSSPITASVSMSGSSVVCNVGVDLPPGTTNVLTLTAGSWTPTTTANAALFPAMPNANKGTYTVSNLITPPIYNAAMSTSNFKIQFSNSAQQSCALTYPQIGTTSGPGGNTPGTSSGQQLLFSVFALLGSIALLLLSI